MDASRNYGKPSGPFYVTNLNLGGGLNTLKSPHMLDRSQLPFLSNYWFASQNAISKRAGNVAFGTVSGATGAGTGGKGLISCKFAGVSYIITQQGTTLYSCPVGGSSYTNIGTVGTGPIRGAQMYDPNNATSSTADGTVFIVDGQNPPWVWTGTGSIAAATGTLPKNFANLATITPKYVATAGNNSLLFYAGEPTFPGAVFISNPFFPSVFNSNTSTTSAYSTATYIPYIVGQNDGVNGGDITGIEPLYSMMMVYKQSAIYAMMQVGLYEDLVWKSQVVSASVGCVAPRSIARFDTFHVFLGIDGVYMTDGFTTQCISRSVPTFFDGSLTGNAPIITTRSTAIGVRQGNRYLLFFENSNTGYPTMGICFDFNKQDENGLPVASLINGMLPNGCVTLNGPNDNNAMIWTDAVKDRIGSFGSGFTDFGAPFTCQFATKLDFFAEELGQRALVDVKRLQNVNLALSVPQQTTTFDLTFEVQIVSDLLNTTTQNAPPIPIMPASAGTWGVGSWGTMLWSSSTGNSDYGLAKVQAQDAAEGHVLQMIFTETSPYPYTVLGYTQELNDKREAA